MQRSLPWRIKGINPRKTRVLSKIYDFPQELNFSYLLIEPAVVSELQLVGVVLSNDLKWQKNTDCICEKATSIGRYFF